MFVSCINIIVKHVQRIGIIRAFCLPGGTFYGFQCLGGQKKLLGCRLLGGISTQTDTIFFLKYFINNIVNKNQSAESNCVVIRIYIRLNISLAKNCVPCVLKTFLRAKVPCMLTYSRVNVPWVVSCTRANAPCVLTCLPANVPCVLMCSRFNVLCVLMC